MLSTVNVFFFQNCSQHASIALQADLQSLSSKITSKNTFFVYKNSEGDKLSPILQSDSPDFEAIKNNPSYSFSLQTNAKIPMELPNGTVTEVTDNSFFFIPKKDFIGQVEIQMTLLMKLEVATETQNAVKGADGKSYMIQSEPISLFIFVHDHIVKIPENLPEQTDNNILPVELDQIIPLKPEQITLPPKFDSDSLSPILKWTDGYDVNTGVDYYEIAVGTKECGDDVVAWKNVGFKVEFQTAGKFEPMKKYYPSVRTVDFKGLKSEPQCGEAWIVQSTFLPFSFTNQTGVGLEETITSNGVRLTGEQSDPQTAVCTGCLISRNSGPFQAQVSGFVIGDLITLQLKSSKVFNTESLATLKFGSLQIPAWSVKTTAAPNAITIATISDANTDTVVPSEFAMLLGVKVPVKFTLSGDGNPQLSLKGSGKWASSGTLNPNDVFQLQMKSASTPATEVKCKLVIGDSIEVPWTLKTFTPAEAFAFKNVEAAPMNTEVRSEAIYISGLNKTLDVTISGSGNPQICIASRGCSTTGKINPGEKMMALVTSASKTNTETLVTIKVGTTSSTWSVKTTSSINPFTVPAFINASKSTDVISASVSISGFSAALKFTLSGDGSPQVSFDGGGSWLTSGLMPATATTLKLKLRSSSSAGTESKATITFDGASPVAWTVTTVSRVEPFTFPEMDPQPLNQRITSNEVTVTGTSFKSSIEINISGDGGPCFMINNGVCANQAALKPGDKLKIQTQSKTTLNATSNVTVKFGTGTDVTTATWTFKTSSAPTGTSIVNAEWADVKAEVESESTLDLTGYSTDKFTFKVSATIDDVPSSSLKPMVSLDNGSTWVTSGTLPLDASIKFKMTTGTNYTDYYKKSMKVVFAIDGITTKWTWTVKTIPVYSCGTVPTAYLAKQTYANGYPSMSYAISYSNGILTCNSYRSTFPLSSGALLESAYPGKLPTGAFVKHFYNDGSEGSTQDTDRCQSGKMVCSEDRWPFDNTDANGNIVSGFCMCK
jgi:hypothetical protein